jgi:hypothetical protein
MKKLVKGSSFLLYSLSILVFFFVGVFYVMISGAAEGQGLAAGAIVIGNGIIFASIALVASIVLVYYSEPRVIKKVNVVLVFALVLSVTYLIFRNLTREDPETTSMHKPMLSAKALAMASPQEITQAGRNQEEKPGLGFFKPTLFDTPALYFYGNPNFMEPVMEHPAFDSLSFQQLEYGGYDISYAPPWFAPHHLKLDYDMLYLKVVGVTGDFAEVVVNKVTGRTAYINRYAGKIIYWPDFLLHVHSIKMLPEREQTIRVKPLDYAGEVNIPHVFMKPVMVKEKWVKVQLLDDDFQDVGEGCVRWRDENGLLIGYSLLS